MIKVLIVDDELLVRTHLKYLIDWKMNNYEICGEATNGLEALRLIEKTEPHILITDVTMPLMNGIALVQTVRTKYPDIQCVMLSNYDDFEFVRDAMKSGVFDYVLKHNLNEKTLLEALDGAKGLLSEKKRAYPSLDQNNLLTLRNKFVNGLLAGLYHVEEIKRQVELLEVKLGAANNCAILLIVDDYRKISSETNFRNISLMQFGIVNIIEEILKDHGDGVVAHVSNEQFVLLLSFRSISSQTAVDQSIHALLERIKLCLKNYLNLSATFVLGKICRSLHEVKSSYDNAVALLDQRFLRGKSSVLKPGDVNSLTHSFSGVIFETEQCMLDDIRGRRYDDALRTMNGILDSIVSGKLDLHSSQVIFHDLVNTVNRVCKENDIGLSKMYLTRSHLDIIMNFESIDDARGWFVSLFEKLFAEIDGSGGKYDSPYVNSAVRYIHAHYSEDISLGSVAKHANISSVYLSKLFNEQVGIGLPEYLNEVRLKFALELWEQGGHELKDVIKMCGYMNYPYFFRVFKKKYGVTPKQYWELRKFQR